MYSLSSFYQAHNGGEKCVNLNVLRTFFSAFLLLSLFLIWWVIFKRLCFGIGYKALKIREATTASSLRYRVRYHNITHTYTHILLAWEIKRSLTDPKNNL